MCIFRTQIYLSQHDKSRTPVKAHVYISLFVFDIIKKIFIIKPTYYIIRIQLTTSRDWNSEHLREFCIEYQRDICKNPQCPRLPTPPRILPFHFERKGARGGHLSSPETIKPRAPALSIPDVSIYTGRVRLLSPWAKFVYLCTYYIHIDLKLKPLDSAIGSIISLT